jgi:hypothetical protein
MLPSMALCALVLGLSPKPLSEPERAALAVLRYETAAERHRQLDRKAVVSFSGDVLTEAEWSVVRGALTRGEPQRPPVFPLRNLLFRRIDGLEKNRYRVGVVPQTHPPGLPMYTTYVVALSPHGDKVVSAITGRVMAQTPR